MKLKYIYQAILVIFSLVKMTKVAATYASFRVVSFNAGDINNPSANDYNLHLLFDDSNRTNSIQHPDFQVIGFQEAPTSLIHEDVWVKAMVEILGKRKYVLHKKHRIGINNSGAILLCIFIKKELLLYARNFETESVKTGFGGYGSNKGGVSLRFTYNGNSFCFTNAHLAAHQDKLQERINDYNSILDGTKFRIDPQTSSILSHDYSVWFGDLNFRVDGMEKDHVVNALKKANRLQDSSEERKQILSSLFAYDQLTNSKKKGLVFQDFIDCHPNFLPTYKYHKGSENEYNSNERIPSWTDRVLYRYHENAYNSSVLSDFKPNIELIFFDSIKRVTLSDHKPVVALFKIKTFDPRILNTGGIPYEPVKFEPIIGWERGKDNKFWYSISDELFRRRPKLLSTSDRVALYHANFSSLEDEITFVYPDNIAYNEPLDGALQIPYLSSPSTPDSPSTSRRSSLNYEYNRTLPTEREAGLLRPSEFKPYNSTNRKYFTATIPDDLFTTKGNYVLLYLSKTVDGEFNVFGISDNIVL